MDPAASSSSRLNSFIEALDPSISTTEFRFLSEKPHHPRRSRFVESENLCSVLRIDGGVRDAAKLIITRVATVPIGYAREGDGGCIVDSADHLLGVLSFAGATLQDLQLTGKIAVPQASVPSWTTSLTAHIAALRKLDISGWKCRVHVEDLLDAMSGRVETLTANLSPAGFVAVHGEGIRHLTFNVSGDGFPRDDTKWYRAVKPIGLALESFTAPNLYMCKPAFNFLAGNCPKLRRVVASPYDPDLTDGFAQFLSSFGSHLQVANVNSLCCNADSMRKILEQCPNAVFNYFWYVNPQDLKTECVRAIADRMKPIDICLSGIEPEDVIDATRACSRVEQIFFECYTVSASATGASVQALRPNEKPPLCSLELNMKSCGIVTDALRFAGHCTGALRVFKMHCQPQENGAFDAVSKASPLLEEVFLNLSLGRILALTCSIWTIG